MSHTIEDLIDWCEEDCDARVTIKMGMQRTADGKKLPLAYNSGKTSGVVPTYPQFCPGGNDIYKGGLTSTGKELWGIEDHKGTWKGFKSEHKVHAVFPHLHPNRNLFILDADPGPRKIWESKQGVLEWLAANEDYKWLLDCPYTETQKGWHFYFFCDGSELGGHLPPLFPMKQKKMFSAITDDSAELFGGTSWELGGTAKVWVWETKKRPLLNWKGSIPHIDYDAVLKPLINPATQGWAVPKTPRSVTPQRSAGPLARGTSAASTVSIGDVPEFTLDMLKTQDDKHLYELCFQVDNLGSYEDAYFLIGAALHQKCGGATDTWHLPLWCFWCDGGPEDASDRERLMLDPGPPRARSPPQSHTSASCAKDWGGFRSEGVTKSFGSVMFYLDHDPNTKHKFHSFRERHVKEIGLKVYTEDLQDLQSKADRRFDFEDIAQIAKSTLPPLLYQTDFGGNSAAMYMLAEREGRITGRWERNSEAFLHQKLLVDTKQSFKAARKVLVKSAKDLLAQDPEANKEPAELMLSRSEPFFYAAKVCDDFTQRNKVIYNLRSLKGVMDDKAVNKFFDAQYKMVDKTPGPEQFCYFPFTNGLFNLTDGSFRPADPEEYLYFTTGYEYDHDHVSQRREAREEVLKYIFSLFGGKMPGGELILAKEDKARFVTYILLDLASSMRPGNYFQKITFLLGSGGNSKGVLIGLLMNVFGVKKVDQGLSRSIPSKLIEVGGTPKDANAPNTCLAETQQCRIACVAEPAQGKAIDIANLKLLTGNNDVTSRGLYEKNNVTFKPLFAMYVECNSIPPPPEGDGGWGRRFREVKLFNSFKDPHPDTHFVTPEQSFADLGITVPELEKKAESDLWRGAFFDILAAFYKNVFLPFAAGELGGKFNLPMDYACNNDKEMMDALAPEWSEGTANTLGAGNQLVEWFHKSFTITIPDDVDVYREKDGTLHRDFLKPMKNKKGEIINPYNYSIKFEKHKKENWYHERGVDKHPVPVEYGEIAASANEMRVDTFVAKFEKECPGATDFLRCKKRDDKMLLVLQQIPKLGIVKCKNQFRFFGYRRRQEEDPAYVAAVSNDGEVEVGVGPEGSATARYNATTTVDDGKLYQYLVRSLVDLQTVDIDVEKEVVAGDPDPVTLEPSLEPSPEPSPDPSPEPSPDPSPIAESEPKADKTKEVKGSGLSARHTYTDLHPKFRIAYDAFNQDFGDSVDVYDVDDNTTLSSDSSDSHPDDLELMKTYVDNWMYDSEAFWMGLENVPCIVIGQVPTEDEIKLVNKITKRMTNKQVKVNGDTTGLVPSDPSMTADEYLEKMEEKYYWRVYGPTEKHEFGWIDVADADTWPNVNFRTDHDGPYVRYGAIKVVGPYSIVNAKISPSKFDLRCVDSTAGYVHWQSEEKKVLFEKMRPLCAAHFLESQSIQSSLADISFDTSLSVPWLIDGEMVGLSKEVAKEEPKKKVQAKEEPKKKVQAKQEKEEELNGEGTPESTTREEFMEMSLRDVKKHAIGMGCDPDVVKMFHADVAKGSGLPARHTRALEQPAKEQIVDLIMALTPEDVDARFGPGP